MFERHRLSALLFLALGACEPEAPKQTLEQQMRAKYVDQDCYISSRKDLAPTLMEWHTRADCPDLEKYSYKYEKDSRPGDDDFTIRPAKKVILPALPVRINDTGLLDAKGFRYEAKHCPKCAY